MSVPKIALVTGGSRGIGAAVAIRLAADGTAVAIGYRAGRSEADAVVESIVASGGRAIAVQGDLSVTGEPARLVEKTVSVFGGLDILVNAAAVAPYRSLDAIDEEHVRAMLDTNVSGAIMLTKAAVSAMKHGGRIVHVSSRLATSPIPGSSVYAASKAAVSALVHGLARELGPRGITINAVAPGVIETDMTRNILSERGDQILAATPLGRIGQPADVAGVVAFLVSEDARWVTGRSILVDGGMS